MLLVVLHVFLCFFDLDLVVEVVVVEDEDVFLRGKSEVDVRDVHEKNGLALTDLDFVVVEDEFVFVS